MTRLAALHRALAPSRPVRIVDVGANPLGPSPYARMLADGCAEVVGFEPQPEAYRAAVEEAPINARFVNAAIGDGTERQLHVYRRSGMTSLFPLRDAATRYLGRFEGLAETGQAGWVETERLDDVDGLRAVDFLKVDAQGAEVIVIEGGRRALGDAVAVMAEMRFYPLYEGEPTMGDLDAALRAQGFVMHRMIPPSRSLLPSRHAARLSKDARSQVIDGDVIYIRPLEDLAAWETEALKRLALLAEGAFRSHDLCLMLIDELEDRGACANGTAEAYVNALPAVAKAA